jgi:hypothetical protein
MEFDVDYFKHSSLKIRCYDGDLRLSKVLERRAKEGSCVRQVFLVIAVVGNF